MIVGVYTSLGFYEKSKELGWRHIENLQDKIGLNLVIIGFPETGNLDKLVVKLKHDPDYMINDKDLGVTQEETEKTRQFITEAHKKSIKVWSCMGAGFAEMPKVESMLNIDIFGNVVEPSSPEVWNAWSWCPSDPIYRKFLSLLASYIAKKYDLDGFTFTHMRFSPLGLSPLHFFSCACKKCARQAEALGYDFEGMISALKDLTFKLKNINSKYIHDWMDSRPSFLDVLQWTGHERQIVDWISFRCDLMSSMFDELYSSTKSVRNGLTVGSDNFPPSFSLLSGHRYEYFVEKADFLSPLLSHPMLFAILGFVELAKLLKKWNKTLDEGEVLTMLHHVFGYSHLELPVSVSEYLETLPLPSSDYESKRIKLSAVVENEARKAKLFAGQSKPMYGVIAAHDKISPRGVYERTKAIVNSGMEGIILQVGELPGPEANINIISDILKG